MPAKKGTDDESETMPVRWTVYRIQLRWRVDYGDNGAGGISRSLPQHYWR